MRTLSTRYRKPFLAFILIIACSFLLDGCTTDGADCQNGYAGYGTKVKTAHGAPRHSF